MKIRRSTRTRGYRMLNKTEISNLILEIEEVIKGQDLRECIEFPNYFCFNNVYYRILFHNLRDRQNPLYEYRIKRANYNITEYIPFQLEREKEIKSLIINNNYEPIWLEDFYFYPKGHDRKCGLINQGEVQLDYFKKQTFWVDCESTITLK